MKQCHKCKKVKNLSDFFKDNRSKDGLYSICKYCHTNVLKISYSKNRENIKKWAREYKRKYNQRKYVKEYKKSPEYKKWHNEYMQKHRSNPKHKISNSMRALMGCSLKGKKSGRKWQELTNYTIDDLMTHLEQRFDDKMNWGNYGDYWWIDHIKPISLFNYKETKDKEFKECWALENLQPMEKIQNIKKGNKSCQ